MNQHDRDMLDFIQVPVFALELDEHERPVYTAYNRTACRNANVKAEDVLGLTARELYSGKFGEIAYAWHCQVIKSGRASTYELTLPFGGKHHHVRTSLTPVLDAEGRLIRLVGTSEKMKAEYAVRETQAKVMMLNTEIETFINMAAHDLRSPICNVTMLANLLREGFQEAGLGNIELVDKLEQVASSSLALIDDVLEHARITGTTEAVEQFELTALCDEILGMLDPNEQHATDIEGCWLFADRVAVQVALRNLIDNAFKHNLDKKILLSVTVDSLDSEHFEVSVVDNGVGYPDEIIDFLDGGDGRIGNGFGLLGIRRLIHQRGGQIVAERLTEGKGARVRFSLPGKIVAKTGAAEGSTA